MVNRVKVTPEMLMTFLGQLEIKLGESRVRAFFRRQSPAAQNAYSLFRGEVTHLRGELTLARLEQVAERLAEHSATLSTRVRALKTAITDLSSARRVLEGLDRFVGLVSRVAVFLL